MENNIMNHILDIGVSDQWFLEKLKHASITQTTIQEIHTLYKSIISHAFLIQQASHITIFDKEFQKNIYDHHAVIESVKYAVSKFLEQENKATPLFDVIIKKDLDVYNESIKDSKFLETISQCAQEKNQEISDILSLNLIDKSKKIKMQYEIDVYQKDNLRDFRILNNGDDAVKKVVEDIPSFQLFTDDKNNQYLRVAEDNNGAIIKCRINTNMQNGITNIFNTLNGNI